MPIEYGEGFNLNGIAASGDGRYLVAVQSNSGNLYRADTESREVTQIDLGGEALRVATASCSMARPCT
jgi:sugar lactone lactonase YvrE